MPAVLHGSRGGKPDPAERVEEPREHPIVRQSWTPALSWLSVSGLPLRVALIGLDGEDRACNAARQWASDRFPFLRIEHVDL